MQYEDAGVPFSPHNPDTAGGTESWDDQDKHHSIGSIRDRLSLLEEQGYSGQEIWNALEEEIFTARTTLLNAFTKLSENSIESTWQPHDYESLTFLLEIWKFARKQEDRYFLSQGDEIGQEDFWTNKVDFINRTLACLYQPRDSFFKTTALFSYPTEVESTEIVQEVITSSFPDKHLIAEFMAYSLWLSKDPLSDDDDFNSPDSELWFKPSIQTSNLQESSLAFPLLFSLEEASRDGNGRQLEQALTYLISSSASRIADEVFLYQDPDQDRPNLDQAETESLQLSEPALLDYSVAYIKAFGFIPWVEVTSKVANKNEALKRVFDRLQGVQVLKIYDDLEEIYDEVKAEFKRYYDAETTEYEATLVEKTLDELLNMELAKATVADLAAGLGRMTDKLLQKGCEKVIAVEPVHEFLAEIEILTSSYSPERSVVLAATFDTLSESIKQIEANPDMGICFGRSLPHARTWTEVLVAFVQMNQTCPLWLFDYPNPLTGSYLEKVTTIEATLKAEDIDLGNSHLIYDSPDGTRFFNRLILEEEQILKLGLLLGVKITKLAVRPTAGDDPVNNEYYRMEPDRQTTLDRMFEIDFVQIMYELGMLRKGDLNVTLNTVIPAWGLTLGQILVHRTMEFNNQRQLFQILQQANKQKVSKVVAEYDAAGKILLQCKLTPEVSRAVRVNNIVLS